MSDHTHPAKRLRRDEDTGAANPTQTTDNFDHDAELWFEDGNIVLVSAGGVAFRVYRGLLAAQSTVFADMLASSSSREDETVDGSPTVRLSDSPEDLRHFLRVLFPKTRRLFYSDDDEPYPTFHQVSAMIRLAHKYHVEDILRQALSALKTLYPDDWDEFDSSDHENHVDCDEAEVAVSAVNLARLTDTPSLLPGAFYKCCTLGGAVVDGFTREDGTVEYLSAEDLKRCFVGRDRLAKEAFSIVADIYRDTESDGCKTGKICRAHIRKLFTYTLHLDNVADAAVLDSFEIIIKEQAEKYGLCKECTDELLRRDVEARKKVWLTLPGIFDIAVEGWGSTSDDNEEDDEEDEDEEG